MILFRVVAPNDSTTRRRRFRSRNGSSRSPPLPGLLYRYRQGDSQAMSVWLCTRNDCIANIAVMLAGAGVWASATAWPDIAVAAIIACLGLSSAVRVIRHALLEMRVPGIARGVPAE